MACSDLNRSDLSRLVNHTYDPATKMHEATYELRSMPGLTLGIAVCEAFGLDPMTVRALTLHLDVNEIPTLSVEHVVDAVAAGAQVVAALSEYDLHRKES